jgi:hypothetical protein
MSEQPHWSYWGNGMPADLTHITEEMAAASRERRAEVMAKCPPVYASDVGEEPHYRERSERAGIAAALAVAPTVGLAEVFWCSYRLALVEQQPDEAPNYCVSVTGTHAGGHTRACPGPHHALLLGPEVAP